MIVKQKFCANWIGKIRDLGITVVVIEHAMELMMNICDRLVVLNFGKKLLKVHLKKFKIMRL